MVRPGYIEILREIWDKGLRNINDEINATAPLYQVKTDEAPTNSTEHVRPGFEKYHPAFYDAGLKNNKGMA